MARCPECGAQEAEGCTCAVADSDCFSITGDGSEEVPFIVEPVIDPDEDNLLSCGEYGEGMLAILPDYILNPPAASVYRSVPTAIANNLATTLDFSSVEYDTDNMHSTVTNPSRITFVTSGIYVVTFVCEWDKNAVGDRSVFIRKNGLTYLGLESKHAGDPDLFVGHSLTIQESFSAGNYIEVQVKQDSGGSLNLIVADVPPKFCATFLRPQPAP